MSSKEPDQLRIRGGLFVSEKRQWKFERLEIAAENLIQDVRLRYKMEEDEQFKCPFMQELEAAWRDLQ